MFIFWRFILRNRVSSILWELVSYEEGFISKDSNGNRLLFREFEFVL